MEDKKRKGYFEYSEDSHPIVIKSQEQFDELRAKAQKEKAELLERIEKEKRKK